MRTVWMRKPVSFHADLQGCCAVYAGGGGTHAEGGGALLPGVVTLSSSVMFSATSGPGAVLIRGKGVNPPIFDTSPALLRRSRRASRALDRAPADIRRGAGCNIVPELRVGRAGRTLWGEDDVPTKSPGERSEFARL